MAEAKLTFFPLYVEDLVVEPEELRVAGAACEELTDCEGFSTTGDRRWVDFWELEIACMASLRREFEVSESKSRAVARSGKPTRVIQQ